MLDDYLTNNNITQVEFSVSEISNKIKWILENNLGTVKIRGEVSGLKIASSGHCYFSLKDNNAILAATCWRYVFTKVNFKVEDGLEVVVTGKITAYAGQSKYQISVDLIEPYGIGAFIKILNERRQKFEKEGLFDKEHKKKIPFLPRKIGIVTSISGAVIRDIIHRVSDRCPSHIIIWPVSVQGEPAAGEIASAIEGFNRLDNSQKPDLLIIARGGGSIEDLWAFNEEIVVRAVFNSKIPTISAVGHETDYTLIDFVADLRAPTPTAAAEFAVPVLSDLIYTLTSMQNRIQYKMFDILKYYTQRVDMNYKFLIQLKDVVAHYTQRIDELSFRLIDALPNLLRQKQLFLQHFSLSRLKPIKVLKYKYLQYTNYNNILVIKKNSLLIPFEHKLSINTHLLKSLDYKNVINRGFAIVRNESDKIITSINDIKSASSFKLDMKDGQIEVHKKL